MRGTPLDVFARLPERRLERQLVVEYEATVATLSSRLSASNYDLAVRVACLPDQIRGYDRIKLESAKTASVQREALMEKFRSLS